MSSAFFTLLDQTRPAFTQDRVFERAKTMSISSLLCLGRHTITGLLSTCGQQFVDWSAAYRIFEQPRFDPETLFNVPLQQVLSLLDPLQPIVAFLDDTLLHKSGGKVYGTAWRRDPLGPAFSTNLVWSQRFLQSSLALPEHGSQVPSRARAIPVAFTHCPTARKPSRRAAPETWEEWKTLRSAQRISIRGAEEIKQLRSRLDHSPETAHRTLVINVDGGYTNREVFSRIPHDTTIIGRIRKDACLWHPPAETARGARGRKRQYGDRCPTPEEIRTDTSIPWQTITVCVAGASIPVGVKSIDPVLWRPAGATRQMRLIIVKPLAYRLRKGGKLLLRQPGYLLCTDLSLTLQEIVQWYLWRWEIEVNFRDEKTILGVGQAQVWNPAAVEAVPQLQVAAYACLLLAQHIVQDHMTPLPLPAWRQEDSRKESRVSTQQMISLLRAECWGLAISDINARNPRESTGPCSLASGGDANPKGLNFSDFVHHTVPDAKPKKIKNTLKDAVCYAMN